MEEVETCAFLQLLIKKLFSLGYCTYERIIFFYKHNLLLERKYRMEEV